MMRSFQNVELLLRDDGRTVDGRIVPYNEIAEVVERNADGELERYSEMFLPRSCARLAQAVKRRGNASFIEFRLRHDDDFDTKVGYAADLRDEDDGAYASFRLYESRDLDKVRSMLKESHNGLSVHFADVRPARVVDGVTQRVQVHIDHVAATPVPTYAGAAITSMRSDESELGTPELDRVKDFLASLRA